MTRATQADSAPAKVVLERRVRPGAGAEFEAWVRELLDSAGRSQALEGASVLSARGEYVILLRFASQSDLHRWQSAPDTTALLARGARHSSAVEGVVRTGFETWFTLPGQPMPVEPPPRWKMALVTWAALFPLVLVLVAAVPPDVPFAINVALTTAIPTVLLTWVIMPRATRILHGWLYAGRAP